MDTGKVPKFPAKHSGVPQWLLSGQGSHGEEMG
jgi:hypothetical protein